MLKVELQYVDSNDDVSSVSLTKVEVRSFDDIERIVGVARDSLLSSLRLSEDGDEGE